MIDVADAEASAEHIQRDATGASNGDAGRTHGAVTTQAAEHKTKWWNAYQGLQFLHIHGSRRSLPPLSGAYSLKLLDTKFFWEGDMDELFVCHVAETSTASLTGENKGRHLCITITSFESGVDVLHGLPQVFWHEVDAGFHSGRCTTWPFDETDLKAAWRWGDGYKNGSWGPNNAWVFDATALSVPGAEPLVYTDAAELRAGVDALGTKSCTGAAGRRAGDKLMHLLASVSEQVLSTHLVSEQILSTHLVSDPAGAERAMKTVLADSPSMDPAAAAALAMLPAARQRAVGALVAKGEATLEDVRAAVAALGTAADGSGPRSVGHLRAVPVEAWEARFFCTDVSAGGIFASHLDGGEARVRDRDGKRPKNWKLGRSAGKLVVPLETSGLALALRFRLRRLPLNGLMLSIAHHSEGDEAEITIEVNGQVLATISEDVTNGSTWASLANESALVHSVHVPPKVLKHGALAPGGSQQSAPGQNTLVVRTSATSNGVPKYKLRALRLQPWVEYEPVSPEAVEAVPPPACVDMCELWPLFQLYDWMHVIRSVEWGGSRWTQAPPAPLSLADDEGEAFRVVGMEQDGMYGTSVVELAELCFDVEVRSANGSTLVFYCQVVLDSRITGPGEMHDQVVPDFSLLTGCVRDGKDVDECDAWFNSLVDALTHGGEDEAWLMAPDPDYAGRVVFGPAIVAEARRTSEPAARFQLLLGAIAGRVRRALSTM